jgi:hypothetical protein
MDVVELYLISCAHWSGYEVVYLCCVGYVCTCINDVYTHASESYIVHNVSI